MLILSIKKIFYFLSQHALYACIFTFLGGVIFYSVLSQANAEIVSSDLLPLQSGLNLGNSSYPWSRLNDFLVFDDNSSTIIIKPSFAVGPMTRLHISNGVLYIDNSDGMNRGLIMKNSAGNCFKWTPNPSNGAVVSTSTTCP